MQEPSSLADAILEIPASELQHFFDDLILTFNSLNDLLKDQGILRGKRACRAQHQGQPGRESGEIPHGEAACSSMPTSGSK